MRKGAADFEIGPALVETVAGFCSGYVECVIVNLIDLRERFDEVNGIAFVSSEFSAN